MKQNVKLRNSLIINLVFVKIRLIDELVQVLDLIWNIWLCRGQAKEESNGLIH